MASSKRKVVYSVIAAAIGVLVILALLPEPVPVETAAVERGAMEVTIDEQGKTRVIDRFSIAAPVAGRLRRIELREGEAIKAGQVVARLEPAPLDAATRRELEALRSGAEASAREAGEGARAAQSAWELARTELRRIEGLVSGGVISQSAADTA
ncbi:MAG: biotin/lipoyl-binding protein, partial [Thermoanaerobaculia bacterium]